ncbi:hypothetical protein BH10PSE1_BH10PSE1_00240 [soil metagenome]
MRRVPLLVVCATLALPLALIGCDKGETAPAPVAAPPITAQANDPAAEAFVRSLYANQATADIDAKAPIWSGRTAALLAQTESVTEEGDQGFFEANPICDCQDGEARILDLTTTMHGADSADVLVAYDYGGAEARLWHKTYKLVRENGQWKIDDIDRDQTVEYPEKPLVESLNAWLVEARAQPSAEGGQ